MQPGETFINRPYSNNESGELEQFGQERYTAMISWVNQRIYLQNSSIHWKLFVFLHNLVPTRSFNLGHKAAFLYIKLLFEACFGSYKEFIYKVTLDPSMLDFLNLALSQKKPQTKTMHVRYKSCLLLVKDPLQSSQKKM